MQIGTVDSAADRHVLHRSQACVPLRRWGHTKGL